MRTPLRGTLPAQRKPSDSRQRPASTFRRWVDGFKECLAIAKDSLDVALKVAPLVLVLPAMTLWGYLHKIGWSEIFIDSVGSVPGLVTLLACSCLLFVLLILQFFLPSIFMGLSVEVFRRAPGDRKQVAKVAERLHLLSAGVWVLIFAAVVIWVKEPDIWWVLGTTGAAAAVAAIYSWRHRRMLIADAARAIWHETAGDIVRISALPAFSGFASAFPLLTLIWTFGSLRLTPGESNVAFLACCLVSPVGLFPGVAYMHSQLRDRTLGQTVLAASGVAVALGCAIVGSALYFGPVTSAVLALAGVYDSRPHVYQVLRPELSFAMRAAHLPVNEVRGTGGPGRQPVSFVGAYLRYNFGGVKLLCLERYNPDLVTQIDVDAASKVGKRDPRLSAGDWCLPVKSDDLKPVRRG